MRKWKEEEVVDEAQTLKLVHIYSKMIDVLIIQFRHQVYQENSLNETASLFITSIPLFEKKIFGREQNYYRYFTGAFRHNFCLPQTQVVFITGWVVFITGQVVFITGQADFITGQVVL